MLGGGDFTPQQPVIVVPDKPWYDGWLAPTIGGVLGPILVFVVTRRLIRSKK